MCRAEHSISFAVAARAALLQERQRGSLLPQVAQSSQHNITDSR